MKFVLVNVVIFCLLNTVIGEEILEFGSGSFADTDDEDYNYQDQISPSKTYIPALPTPVPSGSYPDAVLIPELDSDDVVIEVESSSASREQPPFGIPQITPTLPAFDPSSSSSGFPQLMTSPSHSLSVTPSSSPAGGQRSRDQEWNHFGSGDGVEVESTPVVDSTTPVASVYVPQVFTPPVPSNNPPRLIKPINKIPVYGGKFHKQRLDSHFVDEEDAKLKFVLVGNQQPWIYIVGNELHMLPTAEDVSEYDFNLTAQDSQGLGASTNLTVAVRQLSKSRQWYYYFEFTFPSFDNWREVIHLNMTRLGHGAGHAHDNFIVKQVEQEDNFIRLRYVNQSLIEFETCPIEKIEQVAAFYKTQYTNFKYVLTPGTLCDTHRKVSGNNNKTLSPNFPPSIKNPIDLITSSNGELLVYKVPDDFCYDPEEGGTSSLKLELLDYNQDLLKPDNWLQFDSKNREFYGVFVNGTTNPSDSQASCTGKNGGVSGGRYTLFCQDSQGKRTPDVLDTCINVGNEQYNAEFRLHFTASSFHPFAIRKFVEKLASLFASRTDQIKIKSYTVDNNVVHFTWYNKSNPGEKEITQLRKYLFSNEGPVNKRVVELFAPDFNISGGDVVPTGRIIGEDTVFNFKEGPPSSKDEDALDKERLDEEITVLPEYGDYLITYIIPSVLIAVMVLLASIIACLLSRKKKLPVDGNEIRKAGGGVPVIFQDELESEQALLNPAGTGTQPKIVGPSDAHVAPRATPQPQPPPPASIHRGATATPPPSKFANAPPGYKSVAKYEPPLPPVQYSSSASKYHHTNNAGILPPPYVPP